MIEVGAYPTRNEAELAQAALVAAGVQSRLVADEAGGAYRHELAGARLLIDEADAARASEILGTGGTNNI